MNDQERDDLLRKMDNSIDSLILAQGKVHNAIFDTNGDKGLCSQVRDISIKVDGHDRSITRLWGAIFFLVAGGGGTLGLIKLIEVLSE